MLIDEGDGRVVTLLYKVRLTPPEDTPVGDDTDGAQKIADALLINGSAALKKVVADQGYNVSISTACFIF